MKIRSTNFWAYSRRIKIGKTGVWILLGMLLCSNAVIFFNMEKKSYKIGYIDLPKVYEKFKMREEAAANLVKVQHQREETLYSMQVSLKTSGNNPGQKITQADIEDKLQAFKEDNKRMLTEYDKQIWTQLNQYIKDYSKDRQYDILLGADGSGTVMAANDGLDATQEIISYVNTRYAGFKSQQHANF